HCYDGLLMHAAISTLFPYTALFRSDAAGGANSRGRAGVCGDDCAVAPSAGGGSEASVLSQRKNENAFTGGVSCCFRFRQRLPGADRKSTRLNSSHVSISYAVFCVKK